MDYVNGQDLVDTKWLKEHLEDNSVKVLDATWYLPSLKRDGEAEFLEAHIPGSVHFNIDKIADTNSALPHMLPSEMQFSSQVEKLGISNFHNIIVYDKNGGFSAAARVWWMFRVFGHKNVSILNGGFVKWVFENRETESGQKNYEQVNYMADFNTNLVCSLDELVINLETKTEQVLDGRSSGRFYGAEREPREGLPSGHIPNSLNVPVLELFEETDNMVLKSPEKLKKSFLDAGVDLDKPIVTTCGSGVTAAALSFALFLLGHRETRVYDGSWTEWGGNKSLPKSSLGRV